MAHNFLSELTGSFAMPAAENPTVAMIEAAYRHHQLDWRYINCEVTPENLAAAVAGARAMNWAGFNCSLPHKVAVIRHLDGLGESASIMGAVNCVVRRGTSYIGENTDGKGFLASLREIVDPAGRSVVMFGAGGAARAIGVELALAGAAVDYRCQSRSDPRENGRRPAQREDRRQGRARRMVDDLSRSGRCRDRRECHLCRPLSDVDAQLDLDFETLGPGMLVADVDSRPPRTRLIREAEKRGCKVLDGLGMLVNQGVIGVKYWTGSTPTPQ